MSVDSVGAEAGIVVGNSLSQASDFKQGFVESEQFGDINLINIDTERTSTSVFVRQQDIGSHFTLDHPVNGELDSSVFELDTGLGAKTLSSSSEVQT